MLIRDLAGDDESAAEEPVAEDSTERTFVLDSEFDDHAESDDESASEWNYDSPSAHETSVSELSLPEMDDSPERDDSSELGATQEFDDSADATDFEQSDESTENPAVLAQALVAEALAEAPEPVEDDSIEAYMSRLLQRVQGDPAVPAAKPAPPKEAPPAKAAKKETQPVAEAQTEPAEDGIESSKPEPPKDNTPLVPRSQAPELSRNLSAMRDLANQSARNAVARSIRVQARDTQMKAFFKAALALSFIAMAAGVYLFVSWSSTIKIAMIGAFVVLAVVFGQEGYVLARDAKRRLALAETGSGEGKSEQEIEDEIQRIAKDVKVVKRK